MKKNLLFLLLLCCAVSYAQQPSTIQGSKALEVQYLGESQNLRTLANQALANLPSYDSVSVKVIPNKLTKKGKIETITGGSANGIMQSSVNTSAEAIQPGIKQSFNGGSNQDNVRLFGSVIAPLIHMVMFPPITMYK